MNKLGDQVTDTHRIIKECLIDFNFGATIEVTNGMGDGYSSKAKQAKRAKDFLYNLVEKKSTIATGVACLVSDIKPDLDYKINILINVSKYDSPKLREVLENMLDSVYLSVKEGPFVEKILKKSDQEYDIPGFICGGHFQLKERAKYLNMTKLEYMSVLPNLKGLAMELYIARLFEERIANKFIFHRHRFQYEEDKKSDADVVVVCEESSFYNAVGRLNMLPNVHATVLSRKR